MATPIERGGRTDTRQRRQWQKISRDPTIMEGIGAISMFFGESLTSQEGQTIVDPGANPQDLTLIQALLMTPDGQAVEMHDSALSSFWMLPGVSDPAPFTDDEEGRFAVSAVQTADYTARPGEVVRCDPSGGSFVVTLPTAAGNAGRQVIVKNVTSDTNSITVQGSGSETIDGSTLAIASSYGVVRVVSDGTDWMQV